MPGVRITHYPAQVPYVLPGGAGYLGSQGALTPYSPSASGFPGAGNAPSGWSWTAAGLRNDSSPVSLDHAYVYGGLYTAGNVITVTNCIIQCGTGSEIACVQHHGGNAAAGGKIVVTDSTLGWLPGHQPPSADDVAVIFDAAGPLYDIERCDISGTPQGLDPAGSDIAGRPSLVLSNWIHGLVQNNVAGPNHMDGIFSQGGSYLTIQYNYVDAPVETSPGAQDVTAGVFFQDTITDRYVTVDSNYLSGGSYTLRNESISGLVVTNNTFSGLFKFGNAFNQSSSGGSIGAWLNNRHPDGTLVPSP